jgi:hypothetical protein
MTIRFPGRLARVVRACVSPPCVVLQELEEHTNPQAATLTWPGFPEMNGRGPIGPLRLMGVNSDGVEIFWKEEVPAADIRQLLQGQMQGTGYLTIVRECLALYDVMTDDYVWLDSVTRPPDLDKPKINRGHQTLERTSKSWYVNPSQSAGPVTSKPLPRPYMHDTCWLSASGRPLFDVRLLIAFLNNHAGVIGDPYAWETKDQPQGIRTMPVQDTTTRHLVVGEDT